MKKVKGYAIQFNILKKDLPKIKKLLKENEGIILRGIITDQNITMID